MTMCTQEMKPKRARLPRRLLRMTGTVALMLSLASPVTAAMQDYARTRELDPLPAGMASLYRVPWRANARTVSAYDALQGIGVYWKHIPPAWTLEQQTNVMRQLFAVGVRRMRIAPHLALNITA